MKVLFPNNQIFITLLTSMVLSGFGAAVISVDALNIFSRSLHQQILLFFLLWLILGILLYTVISLLSRHYANIRDSLTMNLSLRLMVRKVFLTAFLLFPLGLILYIQWTELLLLLVEQRPTDPTGFTLIDDSIGPFFLSCLVLGILLLFLLFFLARRRGVADYLSGLPDGYFILPIVIVSVVLRIFFIYTIQTQPTSDFANIHRQATLISQYAKPFFAVADQLFTVLIYGGLYTIFSADPLVIQLFHTVTYSLSGMFFYLLGKNVFQSKLLGFSAGMLLVAWPSLAVYSNVLSPEHIFILIEAISLYVIFRSPIMQGTGSEQNGFWSGLWRFILFGVLFGMLQLFRPFGTLFVIAFVLTLLLYRAFSRQVLIRLIALLVTFSMVGGLSVWVGEYINEKPFRPKRWCNLITGTNFASSGQFTLTDVGICEQIVVDAGENKTIILQKVLDRVVPNLISNQDKLIGFLYTKFSTLWTNSNGIMFWARREAEGDPGTIRNLIIRVNLADFAAMFLVTLACAVGVITGLFKDLKPVLFFCLLTIFGFNLMEIPFEVQPRYRTVMMPIMIFFACWTIFFLYRSNEEITRSPGSSHFDETKLESNQT